MMKRYQFEKRSQTLDPPKLISHLKEILALETKLQDPIDDIQDIIS